MQNEKFTIIERFGDVITNVLLSLAASLVRLFFGPRKTFREALFTFAGGIAFGVLVGYLVKDVAWMAQYSNFFVAVSAIAGKEIITALIHNTPKAIATVILSWANSRFKNDKKPDDADDGSA